MSKVYLAYPTYNGQLHWRAAQGLSAATRVHDIAAVHSELSLIALNCNQQWCSMLNGRERAGFEWFAMLHSDVGPDEFWIDTLIAEADKHGADLLSAVVPIKNDSGLTSTAILRPGERGTKRLYRLSTGQCFHSSFPATFGINEAVEALERLPGELREPGLLRDVLLVNTGCMVVRCNLPWAERVWFEDENSIEQIDGVWSPASVSEDWCFSRRVAAEGGKVMATRLVAVTHHGCVDFPYGKIWGQPRDRG